MDFHSAKRILPLSSVTLSMVAEARAQGLRGFTAFAEDLATVPSTHMAAQGDSITLASVGTVYSTYTFRQDTHTHEIKINLKKIYLHLLANLFLFFPVFVSLFFETGFL